MDVEDIKTNEFINRAIEYKESFNKAIRHNKGKLQWSLVDFEALEDLVRVLEFGAEKYKRDNWKKGLPVREICESMLRHTFAFLRGEDIDNENGLPHTGHILCNAMFLSHMAKRKEFDDRGKG